MHLPCALSQPRGRATGRALPLVRNDLQRAVEVARQSLPGAERPERSKGAGEGFDVERLAGELAEDVAHFEPGLGALAGAPGLDREAVPVRIIGRDRSAAVGLA